MKITIEGVETAEQAKLIIKGIEQHVPKGEMTPDGYQYVFDECAKTVQSESSEILLKMKEEAYKYKLNTEKLNGVISNAIEQDGKLTRSDLFEIDMVIDYCLNINAEIISLNQQMEAEIEASN